MTTNNSTISRTISLILAASFLGVVIAWVVA